MSQSDTVTVTRDAWNEMQQYIKGLEDQIASCEAQLEDASEYILELEEKLNGSA